MWKVIMAIGNRVFDLTPHMAEEDAYLILNTLRKYPELGVSYGLSEQS